ncbi:MAG: hypothetical protein ACXVPN_07705 [Bacteroidia bacterium]
MGLNTLVISFYFPPFNRVGGRRWAKHLKYFKQQGENFHVLCGKFEGKSPWDNDTIEYRDQITQVPVHINYPYFKKTLPKNIFQKVYWKLSLNYWHFREKKSKGSFWDDSNGSERNFLEAAVKLIHEKKTNHVLLSVGPFHYSAILIELRKKFPDLKITIDYRDYWEDELHNLTEKQKEYEEGLQQSVLDSVNLVITPNEEITTYFRAKKTMKNVYTLPHCYDPADVATFSEIKKQTGEVKSFLYGGALYNRMNNYMQLYSRFIKANEDEGTRTLTRIFTSQPGYKELLNEVGVNYTMNKYLGVNEYFGQITQSDFILMFRPDWSPNAFSSKYYELLAFRKPILYFGPEGDVSRHLEENNLGLHFSEQNFSEQLARFRHYLKNGGIPDIRYDLNQHTFGFQTKKLTDYLKTIYASNAKAAVLS